MARESRLVALPADGTPNTYVVERAQLDELPNDLDGRLVESANALHELLLVSEEARGARTP